jgi:putative ABC transport system permease protein
MEALWQDVRLGFRSLRRRPAVALTAVLALAVGIGANSATFSVVNAVLLSRLPFADSEALVAVWSRPVGTQERQTSAYPDYVDWKAETRAFERIAVYNADSTVLRDAGEPTPLVGSLVSADLFPLLGVQPELGRTFTEEEDRPGAPPVVVLGHAAWETYFHADPAVVGTSISLGNKAVTVVGVMPPEFKFPVNRAKIDYYMPTAPAAARQVAHRSDQFLRCVARLAPGVTVDEAQAELAGVAARLAAAYPDSNTGRSVFVNSLHEDLVGSTRPALLVLFGAVGLVLLIACANVANLLLASATARRREIALRSALGASRSRIVTQLLVEALLLAAVGGALGLLLAMWLLDALLVLPPAGAPQLPSPGLDARVLLFTLAVSAMVTLAAGLAPALQVSRPDLTSALKEGGRGSSDGRQTNRLRSAMVVTQVALSVMLLVGAGLLVHSFVELRRVDPGFDPSGVLTTTLKPSRAKLPTVDARNRYFERVRDQLAATPGVEAAACIAPVPFGGSESDTSFSVVGRAPAAPGQEPVADYRLASVDYFRAMRIPVLSGREFSPADTATSAPVVVVNESLARRFFPNGDALDAYLVIGADPTDNPNPPPRRIVGVVGDAYHRSLDVRPGPEFYVPFPQDEWPSMDFVVRYRPGAEGAAAGAMRDAMRAVDPDEYVAEPRPLAANLDKSVASQQFATTLLGSFAVIALLLATVGIYGVMSYLVSRRTHEIGIRLALGARASDIVRYVVWQGFALAAIGTAAGLAGAFALSRYVESLLFGVSATDAATFVAGPAALVAVAVVASLVPARRAARVDPTVALRSE